MFRIEFTVKGSGDFPLDMLRYDCCFPADTEAVNNIQLEEGERTIKLCRYTLSKSQKLTAPRWRSFSWDIIEQDEPRKVA